MSLYRLLPYMDELRDIEPALRTHATALELGCGTGRLCSRLVELGLRVTGVDESDAMLAHLPEGVEGIRASIEALDLGRTWSAVLLPSHLINHPDATVRSAFVAAAKRHLAPGGTFFAKRHKRSWLATVQDGRIGESNGVTYHAEHVVRTNDIVSMTLRYEGFGQSWIQSFSTTPLSEAAVEALLRQHGFDHFDWHGADRLWVAASAEKA